MRLRLTAAAALVAAMSAGCGTVQNFAGSSGKGPGVYGGVALATDRLSPGSQNDGLALAVMWPVYAADVALSAVGDTLTLPITLPLVVARSLNESIRDYYSKDRTPKDAPPPPFSNTDQPSHLPPERIHGGIL